MDPRDVAGCVEGRMHAHSNHFHDKLACDRMRSDREPTDFDSHDSNGSAAQRQVPVFQPTTSYNCLMPRNQERATNRR